MPIDTLDLYLNYRFTDKSVEDFARDCGMSVGDMVKALEEGENRYARMFESV